MEKLSCPFITVEWGGTTTTTTTTTVYHHDMPMAFIRGSAERRANLCIYRNARWFGEFREFLSRLGHGMKIAGEISEPS